jgi:hypothetical protein
LPDTDNDIFTFHAFFSEFYLASNSQSKKIKKEEIILRNAKENHYMDSGEDGPEEDMHSNLLVSSICSLRRGVNRIAQPPTSGEEYGEE